MPDLNWTRLDSSSSPDFAQVFPDCAQAMEVRRGLRGALEGMNFSLLLAI